MELRRSMRLRASRTAIKADEDSGRKGATLRRRLWATPRCAEETASPLRATSRIIRTLRASPRRPPPTAPDRCPASCCCVAPLATPLVAALLRSQARFILLNRELGHRTAW